MSIDNSFYKKTIQILTDLIAFKTISGQDNTSLINYCDNIIIEGCTNENYVEYNFEANVHFSPGQRSTKAVMHPLTKRHLFLEIWSC